MKKVLILLTIVFTIFTLIGCTPETPEIPEEVRFEAMTVEEMKHAIQEKFYNEDGTPIKSYWENRLVHCEYDTIKSEILKDTGKDGFELYLMKGTRGQNCFFVEFKPYGYCIGYLRKYKKTGNLVMCFNAYPSPFRILEIPLENSFLYVNVLNCGVRGYCATMRNDALITIDDEAIAKFIGIKHTYYWQFDYEINRWIEYYYKEDTQEWKKGYTI